MSEDKARAFEIRQLSKTADEKLKVYRETKTSPTISITCLILLGT